MATKSIDEQMEVVDQQLEAAKQKVNRLKAKQKNLKNKKEVNERKKRDHAMIVVGSTLMTHYSDELKEKIINSNDDEIINWVHSLFKK